MELLKRLLMKLRTAVGPSGPATAASPPGEASPATGTVTIAALREKQRRGAPLTEVEEAILREGVWFPPNTRRWTRWEEWR